MSFRSLLFAPAVRPERFARAAASGADAMCIDLEDAVAQDQKEPAREAAAAFLAEPHSEKPAIGVRINSVGTPWWEADLAAIGSRADFVMVPKIASATDLARVAERVTGPCALWPLIETPAGVRFAWDIAAAVQVEGVLFGAFDYAAETGCAMEWEPLLFARSTLAAACANAQVDLLDSPAGDVRDEAGLVASSQRAKALGFTGRACIHPDQVAPVNAAFTPTLEEVRHAKRVLAAFDAAGGGAALLDGKLIELPLANAARRVLSRI